MQPGPLASQSSSRKVDFSSAPSGAAGAERVQTASPREEGLCPLRCPTETPVKGDAPRELAAGRQAGGARQDPWSQDARRG